MAAKQVAEDLRLYARSERHAHVFQQWTEQVRHQLAAPAVVIPEQAPDDADAAMLAKRYFAHLRTRVLGSVLLFSPSLPSTQVLLRETLQPAAPSGIVCYTPRQAQGHGRGTNAWVSPDGCLTFSFQSTFTNGHSLPFVQYLVSLAIVQAVEVLHPEVKGEKNPVRIKWPNDIYAKNSKIGGILCQSEFKDQEFHVTTGVGFNISNKEPTLCLQDLLGEAGKPVEVQKETFLATFLTVYEEMELKFKEEGFAPFQDAYLQHWLHTDQVVQVAASAEDPDHKVSAVVKGLTSSGCLLAESEGESFELYPDGNSFDFMSGLLKRKL